MWAVAGRERRRTTRMTAATPPGHAPPWRGRRAVGWSLRGPGEPAVRCRNGRTLCSCPIRYLHVYHYISTIIYLYIYHFISTGIPPFDYIKDIHRFFRYLHMYNDIYTLYTHV
jgi:hypothetical protein